MRFVLRYRPFFCSMLNLDQIGNRLKMIVYDSEAHAFGLLRTFQNMASMDHPTRSPSSCIFRSFLPASTSMIAAADVTTMSSLSTITTSHLCFRYHVTAKCSAAPAKVVAENGDKKSPFLATCCRFWRQYVAVFSDFCCQCGQALRHH